MGPDFDSYWRRNGRVTHSYSQVNMLDINAVRSFCHRREVDLTIAPTNAPFALCLHGEFDGYGDFFSLLARDIEYIELSGSFTVGDLVLTNDVAMLTTLSPKWSRLVERYSGPAVAFRTAASAAWGDDRETFVVVANYIECRAGRDWSG